jgi:hypothetical protein
MIKKAFLMSALCATLIVSIQASTNKTENVDAFSGATLTNECRLVPPFATSSSVSIEWNETYRDLGSATISYGFNMNALTTRDVTASERANLKLMLSGLLANSSYFVFLKMTAPDKIPYGDTATFMTNSNRTLQQFVSTKNVPFKLLNHSVKLGSQARSGDRLALTDCKSRTLFDHVVSANEGIIGLPSAAKGAYFLTYCRQGRLLDKKFYIETSK